MFLLSENMFDDKFLRSNTYTAYGLPPLPPTNPNAGQQGSSSYLANQNGGQQGSSSYLASQNGGQGSTSYLATQNGGQGSTSVLNGHGSRPPSGNNVKSRSASVHNTPRRDMVGLL